MSHEDEKLDNSPYSPLVFLINVRAIKKKLWNRLHCLYIFFRYIARRWTMKYQHFILWTYMKAVMLHQMYYSDRGDSVHV